MKLLTSKIQHYNFEEGEFVEEKKRSYAEVIEIIEEFPWELEREFLVVDLTNPSVSISGLNFDYLKLSLYYNGKFVLHYFDRDDVLYSKSFFDIKDSHRYISEFFQDKLTLSDFRKQNTWLQKNKPHFESADFVYTVTAERVKKYLWSTSAISFAASIFFLFSWSNVLLVSNAFSNSRKLLSVSFCSFPSGIFFMSKGGILISL